MVNLGEDNTEKGGDAQGDTLYHSKNLRSSTNDDTLTGNGEKDRLIGGAGDDDHDDHDAYRDSDESVTVNLTTNENSGGHAEDDTLSNIKNLRSSRFADTLTGGVDVFVFAAFDGDSITDFQDGTDRIELRNRDAIFADLHHRPRTAATLR